MLGRFLEISVATADARASLEFYESLGFGQALVGDVRDHAYAVVSDGRLYLGLHQREMPSPTLTWVRSDLVRHAGELQATGVELLRAQLDEESFHELEFEDPSGQAVALIEARTFSPPAAAALRPSQLGYFEEIGIPTRDLGRSGAFWESLGLVTFDPEDHPFPKVVAAATGINLGLYDAELSRPVLTFSHPDVAQQIGSLRERGHRFLDRLPRGLDPGTNAMLLAPEGTWLLLTQATD
jgi:catechol 2,3-dioxygenase-like lactoylglutathione lyase family enzyme